MATKIFLGEPPANIKQWIIDHVTPAEHPETRFTLEDGTVDIHDIIGPLNQQWMINKGYFDLNTGEWPILITQADIGNTVTSIGEEAFYYCSSLTSMTIGNDVTSIMAGAFSGCSSLTSVTIPDSVTSIGPSAFRDCDSLTSVTIVATGKPDASATNVKNMMIDAGVSESINWNIT